MGNFRYLIVIHHAELIYLNLQIPDCRLYGNASSCIRISLILKIPVFLYSILSHCPVIIWYISRHVNPLTNYFCFLLLFCVLSVMIGVIEQLELITGFKFCWLRYRIPGLQLRGNQVRILDSRAAVCVQLPFISIADFL